MDPVDHRPPEVDDSFDRRLRHAEEKLSPKAGASSGHQAENAENDTAMASFGAAIRVGTELVAGLAVGVAIGYVLGRWTGHKAFFIAGFALLGCGAGMMNVWRFLNGPLLTEGSTDNGRSQRGCRIDD